jgi:ABC-type sugar transport system substrate-binding protein
VGQLAHFAREAGADVVVFTRDRDHDRAQQIEAGIRDAETEPRPKIVGATAIEAIEAWVLALRGEHESESHSKPKSVLQERHQISTTEQMVDFIRDADLEQIPTDAHSLKQWLAQAKKHLQPGVPQA